MGRFRDAFKALTSLSGGELITTGPFAGKDARTLALPEIRVPKPPTQLPDVTSGWFTPLQPIGPFAPPGTVPRQFAYLPGTNILWQPKSGEPGPSGVTFETLRLLADSWDILRLFIETRKDQMFRIPWTFRCKRQPGESEEQFKKRNAKDKGLTALHKFFERPDGEHDFDIWMKMWMEDEIVIDAVSIYAQRDRKGKIASFLPFDGATFNRRITDQGITPPKGQTAYQQVLYGIISGNFTTDDLIYFMRNPRTCRLYGFSRVEQILLTINLGLRRLEFQLQEYLSGNTPEAIVFLPVGGDSGITIDQVKDAQDNFNAMMAGNLATRRQIRFLPSYGTKGERPPIVFPKEALIKDPIDEWLVKIVAFNFGMSTQYFDRQMNRASGETAKETAEEEGLLPDVKIATKITNRCVELLGLADQYECAYDMPGVMDPDKQADADKKRVDSGLNTRNEIREARGEDPAPEENADRLTITTATGVIPLDEKQDNIAAGLNPDGSPKAAPEPVDDKQPPAGGDGKQQAEGGEPGGKKPKGGAKIMKAVPKRRSFISVGQLTPATEKAIEAASKTLAAAFGKMAEKASAKVKAIEKASKPDDVTDEIMKALDEEFRALPPAVQAQLEAAALSGISQVAAQLSVDDGELLGKTNEIARAWAKKRAAEMVGMKWVDDELVDNPNAKWAIDDTTRSDIRKILTEGFASEETSIADIGKAIEEAASFSAYRSDMIARTECARAQIFGGLEMWEKSGLVKSYEWLNSEDEDVCEICEELGDGGPYLLGTGPLPIDDSHPNCRCVLSAVEIAETEEMAAAARSKQQAWLFIRAAQEAVKHNSNGGKHAGQRQSDRGASGGHQHGSDAR